jgi:hypothetical protein
VESGRTDHVQLLYIDCGNVHGNGNSEQRLYFDGKCDGDFQRKYGYGIRIVFERIDLHDYDHDGIS